MIQNGYQLGAFLLIVLFLSITAIQSFHTHSRNVQSEKSFSGDDEDLSNADQCLLCDYFIHKQSKFLHCAYSPVVILAVTAPISYHPHSFIGNYKFTLQGFTNKGPPAFLS